MDKFVTKDECDRTHEPIADFKRETSENFNRVHARLDKLYSLMVTALFSVVASIIIQLVSANLSSKTPPNVEVRIDRSALNTASTQQEVKQ